MAADDDLFDRAMAGVQPLAPGGKQVVRASRRDQPPEAAASGAPIAFEVEFWGEQLSGLAPGGEARWLTALRRGEPQPQRRLDLHGFTRDEARSQVRRFLRQAIDAGLECVMIVHGRGQRSEAGPVLKRALPEWLAEPAHGASVRAFASAPLRLGGGGATLVLLRGASTKADR